jgi:hypothetical protein
MRLVRLVSLQRSDRVNEAAEVVRPGKSVEDFSHPGSSIQLYFDVLKIKFSRIMKFHVTFSVGAC